MDSNTFKQHYIQLLKKLDWFKKAKCGLEYSEDKLFNREKYHQRLNYYNDQIAKYDRLQVTLIQTYGNQLQQSL